jgi:uncharacterized membrane protein YgdD (TMEM256/DUF423 family)
LGIAGALGAIGVLLGAFGGHLLRPVLPLQQMTLFETAVRYHMFHALALFGTALAMQVFPEDAVGLRRVAIAFAAGIVVFSGSLYVLVTTDQRWLSAVTPLGGLAFIGAWAGLAVVFLRRARA